MLEKTKAFIKEKLGEAYRIKSTIEDTKYIFELEELMTEIQWAEFYHELLANLNSEEE